MPNKSYNRILNKIMLFKTEFPGCIKDSETLREQLNVASRNTMTRLQLETAISRIPDIPGYNVINDIQQDIIKSFSID